jgi:hypothetical protein
MAVTKGLSLSTNNFNKKKGRILEKEWWSQLSVLENKKRIEVIQILLIYRSLSLSGIRKKLLETYDCKISLPGLTKHMEALEWSGIVRGYSGWRMKKEDARKRVYVIVGKERVEAILQYWNALSEKVRAGKAFDELERLADSTFRSGGMLPKDMEDLDNLLSICESDDVMAHLTNEERTKIPFWRMLLLNANKFYGK